MNIGNELLKLLDLHDEKSIKNLIELEMSYNNGNVVEAFKHVVPDLYEDYMKIIESDI